VEGVVVDKMLFRFAICGSVPEIFTIKVESWETTKTFRSWQGLRNLYGTAGAVNSVYFLSHF